MIELMKESASKPVYETEELEAELSTLNKLALSKFHTLPKDESMEFSNALKYNQFNTR